MENNKVLIMGIPGMVASHIIEYLFKKTDWNIHGISYWHNLKDYIEHLIPKINSKNIALFYYGNFYDYFSLDNIIKEVMPYYIFHLAGRSFPKNSYANS